MDRLLMHTCCAPCSVYCVEALRGEGIEPVSFWYNPNIHPYQEYKARRDTLVSYAEQIGMELIVREDYGLREFVRAVAGDLDHRCGYCYTHRLEETARYAAEHGYTHITEQGGHWRNATASPSSTGTFGWAFARARPRLGSWGCTCRSTAAASSLRRSATPSKSPGTGPLFSSPAPVRRKAL